jgi:hypothetical protein
MSGWKRLWIVIVGMTFICSTYFFYEYEYRDQVKRCENVYMPNEKLENIKKYINYKATDNEQKKFKAVKFIEKYEKENLPYGKQSNLKKAKLFHTLGAYVEDPFWLQALTVQYNIRNDSHYRYQYKTWKYCSEQPVYASYSYLILSSFLFTVVVGLLLLIAFKLISWITFGFKK